MRIGALLLMITATTKPDSGILRNVEAILLALVFRISS
jgi:hypothetical protein